MPIPDYETLMLPLLRIAEAKKGNEVALIDAIAQLSSEYGLTEEEKRELLPSGGTKFSSRVSWARTYLQKAGLIEATRRGCFKITRRGCEVLKKRPQRIDNKILSQFEEFREFQGRKKIKKENDLTSSETPIESIATYYEQIRAALASELLDRIKRCSPQFFERLVIRLLVQMGYGGSLKDAGQAIGRTGDGGIDGVIREDKLGLDNVYIQAKRWTDKSVGSPDIDQFAGALSKKKATKGIFITTSAFTKDALASVRKYSSRIILIDGINLADYMIDYGIGVSVASTYEIKKIDSDFFDGDLE
ncbi:MAG: restriction endonuclease [Nitrospirales bacterium]|nr:restriction endonuclease [Nitrospirales bacterium]